MNNHNNSGQRMKSSSLVKSEPKQLQIPVSTRKITCILLSCIILAVLTATPVLAGTKYLSGSPNLTVSIAGNNEFSPGSSVPLNLLVQNTGLNNMKIVQSGVVERDDIPSTAKMVKISLLPGDSPILIRTDSQMIGDIKGSESVPASFEIWIPDDANAGSYTLPVTVDYTYLSDAEQEGTDSIVYRYSTKKETIDLPFVVKSAINLEVTDIDADNINAGGSGYLTLTLKNVGTDTGEKAIATLEKSENSPIVPTSGSVFIGTFKPGESTEAKFKVSVSKDAEPQDYPVSIVVTYENADGETTTTTPQKIGVSVSSKIEFSVISEPPEINPGQKKSIEVTYQNDGSAIAYGAEVRISAVDPFSSTDDLAYLGDIKPGEQAVAQFTLSTDADAGKKVYGLDSEVKYRDALDDSHVSETVKVPVSVVKAEGIVPILSNPIVLAFIVVILLGGAYYLYEYRRKNSSR